MPTPPVRTLRTLGAAALVTLAAVGGGVVLAGAPAEPDPVAPPAVTDTPLRDLDTGALAVRREPFCTALALDEVEAALAAEPGPLVSHGNGDTAQVGDDVRDVVHEHSCSWAADDGGVAEAWVFVPPVSSGGARRLVEDTRSAPGCRPLADPPAYGSVSTAVSCRADGERQVSFRGLFGDAWLSCSLTAPQQSATRPALVDRAADWCAAVALAASAGAAAG